MAVQDKTGAGGAYEERLRSAVALAGVGAFDWDARDRSVVWTRELADLLDLPTDGALTAGELEDNVHEADRDELRRRLLALVDPAGPGTVEAEFRIVRPDGSLRWVHAAARAIFEDDDDGSRRPARVVGTVQDITERRNRETDLREREARLRALFSSIDEGYCLCEMIVDDEGRPVDYRFLEINPLFEKLTGLSDPVGRTAHELLPDLEPHWVDTYARVGLGGETMRFENGSEVMGRWFDVFAMPAEPHGRFVLVFQDITQRRQAEEALRESEQRFRLMADNAPVMIWMADADAECTYLSANWYRFTGQTPETGLGSGWLDATHPDDRERTAEAFRAANEGRTRFQIEYRLRRADGMYRWAIDSAAPRTGPDGEFLGYIGSVLDITERKEVEEALQRRTTAERSRRRRAELSAAILAELESVVGADSRASRLVELLVPRIADFAVLELPGVVTDSPVTAVAHHDDSALDRLRHLHDEHGSLHGLMDALEAEPSVTQQLGSHSHVSVPLDVGARIRGTLLLGLTTPTRRPYDDDDEAFVRGLADQVALSLGNARLHAQEHHVAWRLQQALLPDELVSHPAVEAGAHYRAASDLMEVGGDWYETFVLADGRVGAIVGDVVGHGLEAAATMGRLRAALLALAAHAEGPARVLTELDRFASGPGGTLFATACCAALDPVTGELSYASAGHPFMLVLSPGGEVSWLADGRSTPLCVPPPGERTEATVTLEPGATVLLYSDGLVERRREPLGVGTSRLADAARHLHGAPLQELCDGVVAAMNGEVDFEDDVVVLALRFTPPTSAGD